MTTILNKQDEPTVLELLKAFNERCSEIAANRKQQHQQQQQHSANQKVTWQEVCNSVSETKELFDSYQQSLRESERLKRLYMEQQKQLVRAANLEQQVEE